MNILKARDFIDRYVSGYGAPWEEVFSDMIRNKACAQHMAELIDDLERYGQQTLAVVDHTGMVSDGNAIAISLAILDEDIEFTVGAEPMPEDHQVWVLEFEADGKVPEEVFDSLYAYLSFRVEDDWVYPLDADFSDESGEFTVLMLCPSGEYTAERLSPYIYDRMNNLAGLSISAVHVYDPAGVDGEAG